jgi:hypothetical protein
MLHLYKITSIYFNLNPPNSKNMKKTILFLTLILVMISCGSIKSSIKNVDNNAPIPVVGKNNAFIITEYSKDKRYGYDKNYPINIYYKGTKNDTINQKYLLNAFAGPKGEKITYTKLENCCPFPSKNSDVGAGLLDVYELKWKGLKKPVRLYLNIYERGLLMVPVGLSLKKI